MSNIVFQKTYPGGWTKKISQRNFGTREMDTYLYSPTGKKLRSTLELYKYITEHPEYWQNFDPYEINVEKQQERLVNPNHGTNNLIHFLELVNSGMCSQDAFEKTVPKPRKIKEAFRRKDYSKTSNSMMEPNSVMEHFDHNYSKISNSMMGSKSFMEHFEHENTTLCRLSREVVVNLERHFLENPVVPTAVQMTIWARQYQVDFETVKKWFRLQWKGRLNYQYKKSQETELIDTSRTRPIKKFEAEMIDFDESLTQFLQDEEYIIELDNAEEDKDFPRPITVIRC